MITSQDGRVGGLHGVVETIPLEQVEGRVEGFHGVVETILCYLLLNLSATLFCKKNLNNKNSLAGTSFNSEISGWFAQRKLIFHLS